MIGRAEQDPNHTLGMECLPGINVHGLDPEAMMEPAEEIAISKAVNHVNALVEAGAIEVPEGTELEIEILGEAETDTEFALGLSDSYRSSEPHDRRNILFDKFANTRLGRATTKALVGFSLSGGAIAFPAAAAAGESEKANGVNVVETSSTHTTTTTVNGDVFKAKSHSDSSAEAEATLMSNDRTMSKARIKEAIKDGDCKVFDGREVDISVDGLGANGAFGDDNRTSLFCFINGRWYRAACGNAAEIRNVPEDTVQNVVWVKSKGNSKLKVQVVSVSKARAECATENTSAYAFGKGRGEAGGTLVLKNKIKIDARNFQKLVVKKTAKAHLDAFADSSADAKVKCVEDEGGGGGGGEEEVGPNVFNEVDNPNHVGANSYITFCGRETVSNGNVVDRLFDSNTGSFITVTYPGNDPGEYCRDWRAPSTARSGAVLSEEVIASNSTATVSHTDSSEPFPVVEMPMRATADSKYAGLEPFSPFYQRLVKRGVIEE